MVGKNESITLLPSFGYTFICTCRFEEDVGASVTA